MKPMTSAVLAAVAAAGLSLSIPTTALAQSGDAPSQGQMSQTNPWMMGQPVPIGPQWMMFPMGPQGIGPMGPQAFGQMGPQWMMWGPQGMGPQAMGGGAFRFRIVDANSDGVIDDDEAAANREEVFVSMDADEDGALTKEEYLAVGMGPGPMMMAGGKGPFQAQVQERKEAAFAAMDGDGDGRVTQAEWMEQGRLAFQSADTDGNGQVTVWEFRSRPRF